MLADGWQSIDVAAAVAEYRARGFVRIAGVVSAEGLASMRQRAEEIATGRVDHTPFFYQADAASGRYEDMPLGLGWVGPTATYRKIEKLERDDVFRAWLANPLFERIARAVISDDVITLYRAILMTKPPLGGTDLPWHQDGGALWGLSEDPELQIWTALDDCPVESGAMRMAVGSHHWGLSTRLGGAVPAEVVAREAPRLEVVDVPARAGDIVILHNLLWHASGLNQTERTRRAFSACYLPGRTTCVRKKKTKRVFPTVF